MALTKISRSLLDTGVSDSSDATAITIDSNEKVGIGTTSPATTLDVTSSSDEAVYLRSTHATTTNVFITNTNATTGNTASVVFAPANNITGATIKCEAIEDFSTTANRTADLLFLTRKDGTLSEKMRIDSSGGVQIGAASIANLKFSQSSDVISVTAKKDGTDDIDLAFHTQASGGVTSERMRITSAGKIGIGTSSPGGTLDVHTSSTGITVEHDGTSAFNHVGEFFAPNTTANNNVLFAVGKLGSTKNTGYLGYHWVSSGSNDNFAHISHWASDYLFRVYGQGNYYFAGSSVSDRDLKENIVDIPEPSLDKVKQLRVRKFNMIPLGENDVTPTKVGFIAQEVQEAMPNVVSGTDGQKDMAVDTTGIVGHLVKAIQELTAKVEELESKINE